jgi:hypothetical protein
MNAPPEVQDRQLAPVDTDSAGAVRHHLSRAAFAVAMISVPWSWFAAFQEDTWNVTATPAGLAAGALFALLFVTLFGLPDGLRAAGRVRAAAWAYPATAVLMIFTALALIRLPHDELMSVHVLVAGAIAGLIAWSASVVGRTRSRPQPDPSRAGVLPGTTLRTIILSIFCVSLGKHHFLSWPAGRLGQVVMFVAIVITFEIAWLLLRGFDAWDDEEMTVAEPEEFASQWLAAWNAHDLDSLLKHFADDVVFTSPVATQLLPDSDGVIRGKDALRAYWTEGLRRIPDLRFELVGVYAGVETLVLNYRNQKGNLVNEVLRFEDGLVVEGHGTYLGTDNPAGAIG